jgi:phosphatidylglycerol lysyltransferase
VPPEPRFRQERPAAAVDRERALAIVLRHGFEATSFQALESGYRYFFHGSEACVAYIDTGRAWVAAGAPIAPLSARAEALSAFLGAAQFAGKRVCFFGTEQPLRGARGEALATLSIGEQPIWDPRAWPQLLAKHRSLREQLRRARAKGVSTRQLTPGEYEPSTTRAAVERVAERWLGARTMAPMGFLVSVEPFAYPSERCCFVAELDGCVVGFAGLIPVPARNGWFIEDLVRDPKAPNGTSEVLVNEAMRWAATRGSAWLTLGLAPLSGQLNETLQRISRYTRALYDFAGLRAYKAKFRPDQWLPLYLCHPQAQPAWLSLLDVLSAFAQGGFLRFGWRTLVRGPTVVLRALAFLLVPWTVALALVPSERWFRAASIKWAWVGFDVALALGLFRLLRRPRRALVTALALAVSADALVTTLKVLIWNLPRVQGRFDYLLLLLACAAPTLAAIVLWGARRHRLRFL